MKRSMTYITFLLSFFMAQQAFALIEFNVGYQGLMTNSGGGNWLLPGATISGAMGLQADFRFEIPMTGVGLGLRYGKLGLDASSGANSLTLSNDTTSALFAYRFINTGFLLGTVLTYGLTSTGSLKNTLSSAGSNAVSAGSISTYTAGLEFGIKIPILLALEAGVGNLQMSGFGSQTLLGSATKIDMNGTYCRASAGFSF